MTPSMVAIAAKSRHTVIADSMRLGERLRASRRKRAGNDATRIENEPQLRTSVPVLERINIPALITTADELNGDYRAEIGQPRLEFRQLFAYSVRESRAHLVIVWVTRSYPSDQTTRRCLAPRQWCLTLYPGRQICSNLLSCRSIDTRRRDVRTILMEHKPRCIALPVAVKRDLCIDDFVEDLALTFRKDLCFRLAGELGE